MLACAAYVDLNPLDRRASLKGFLSMSLTEYLELLDWTEASIACDKVWCHSMPSGSDP
jgi:hypothetical protein